MTQNSSPLIRQLLPRTNAILFIILFISALSVGPRMLNIDGDLPRHLLMGKIVLETGIPPTHEIFSYPYENKSYIPHEWLAGVIYYSAFYMLGLNGVVLLAGLLIAATFGLIYSEAVHNNTGTVSSFLFVLLGAVVTSLHWVVRPHLLTMLFLAVWLIWIDRFNRGISVRIWIFPTLMLIWANTHAEFISGFLVLFAYLGGWIWEFIMDRSKPSIETGKRLTIITILSFAVSLINPAGFQIWDTVIGYLNNRYLMSRIVETRPPDFTYPEYWPLLLLLGISALILVIRKDKVSPAHFFLVIGFGMLSLVSARNAHLFGVIAPFVLCLSLRESALFWPLNTLEKKVARMESQIAGSLCPIIITVLVSTLILTFPLRGINRFESAVFPIDAVQWLERHPQSGRMFNAFDWGGYILLHLWPEQKVFIESQTDTSGDVTREYETVITSGHGWQDIFEKYNIRWAIIPPSWRLAQELKGQGWETAYQDQTTIILVKK